MKLAVAPAYCSKVVPNCVVTAIGSRPSQKRNFEYYFFPDLLGNAEDANVKAALEEARQHCMQLAVLGSFPRAAETL